MGEGFDKWRVGGARRRVAAWLASFLVAGVAVAADAPAPGVRLRAGEVDTTGGAAGWRAEVLRGRAAAMFAAGQRTPAADGSRLFLVQGRAAWRLADHAALASAGARVLALVPSHACLVAVEAAALERVAALPAVRWIGEWAPAWKVEPELVVALGGGDRGTVTLQISPGADFKDLAARIVAVGGEVLDLAEGRRLGVLRAELPASALETLAAREDVVWMERYVAPRVFNDRAVGATRMNVTNLWQVHGLNGAQQIVGHADTGLDLGSLEDIHPDFAGRVLFAVGLGKGLLGRQGLWSDPDGHGTHTAGSILGSGAASGGQYRGVAYAAQLVHQSLIDRLGLLTGLPLDLNTLFHQAYTNGARIHSDSWGSSVAGRYDTSAMQCDEYVWAHPDMLLVFAASNDGADGDADGVVDLDSLGSPASAKNVLTVGAAESGRPPGSGGYSDRTYGDAWGSDYPVAPISNDFVSASPPGGGIGLAAFSSRGPTDDGRIKPDVVAPGTDIVSVRTRHERAGVAWGELPGNSNYMFSGGTSMATPLTAGAAALVRQYFVEIAGMSNRAPSAALIKATMANGARALSPGQYGGGATQEMPPRPNPADGWGHVDLGASLFPAAPRQFVFADAEAIQTGQTNRYTVSVLASGPVEITLAYSDYPGFAGAARALINDVDLRWIGPGLAVTHPNRGDGPDRANNLETIDLPNVQPGTYSLEVIGHEVPAGPQPYALAALGALTWTSTGQSLRLDAADVAVSEREGALQVPVQREGGALGRVGVEVVTRSGTALAPTDYLATATTLVFEAGQWAQWVNVPLVDDGDPEPDEQFYVLLRAPTGGAALGVITQTVVTLQDDDGPGRLGMASPQVTVDEAVAEAVVTVIRTGGSLGLVQVGYETLDGSAAAGMDYVGVGGTLAFSNGVNAVSVNVPILNDDLPEGAETFALRLFGPTGGATLGQALTTTVVIAASDMTNVLLREAFDTGLPTGWSVVAHGDPAAVWRFDNPAGRANLTGGSNGFAIADSDFVGAAAMDTDLCTPVLDCSNLATVQFSAKVDFRWASGGGDEAVGLDVSTNGAAGPWVSVFSRTGASYRGPLTVTLDLTAQAARRAGVMMRIRYRQASGDWWLQVDDVVVSGVPVSGAAARNVRFAAAEQEAAEGWGVVPLQVSRTGDLSGSVVVTYATLGGGTAEPGVDYVPTNGTLVLDAGQTTGTILLTLLDDSATEAMETIPVALSTTQEGVAVVAPAVMTVRVVDDDAVVRSRLEEHFSHGALPPGWQVTANGDAQAAWRFDDPGGRTNLTGGTAAFAIADSAHYPGLSMDTELRTPPLDCSPFESLHLCFREDFNWYRFESNERADVDVSLGGPAGPWVTVRRLEGAELTGPRESCLDLTALAAGASNVMLRFRYHGAFRELWWQVDDVRLLGAVTGGNRDRDADGLEDWWERWYFGGATNAAPHRDDDRDGLDNAAEQIAGTDPLNAGETLRVGQMLLGGGAVLTLDTVSGRYYRVLHATNMAGGWTPGPSQRSEGDPLQLGGQAPGGHGYYRIEVQREAE